MQDIKDINKKKKRLDHSALWPALGLVATSGAIALGLIFGDDLKSTIGIFKLIIILFICFLMTVPGYIIVLVSRKYNYDNELEGITKGVKDFQGTINSCKNHVEGLTESGKEMTERILGEGKKAANDIYSEGKELIKSISNLRADFYAERSVIDDDKLIELEKGAEKIWVATSSLDDYELDLNKPKYIDSIKRGIRDYNTNFQYILPKNEKKDFEKLKKNILKKLKEENQDEEWELLINEKLQARYIQARRQEFPFFSGFEYIYNEKAEESDEGSNKKQYEFCFLYIPSRQNPDDKYNFRMDTNHIKLTKDLFSQIWEGDGTDLLKIVEDKEK